MTSFPKVSSSRRRHVITALAMLSRVTAAVLWVALATIGVRLSRTGFRRASDAVAARAAILGVTPLHVVLAGAVAVLAGTTVALVKLADSIRGRHLTAVDRSITDWVIDHRVDAITSGFRAVTWLGSEVVLVPLVVVVTVLIAWRAPRPLAPAALFVAANVGAAAASMALKHLLDRPRPPIPDRLVVVDNPAFPSGHATQAAAFFGATALLVLLSAGPSRRKIAVIVCAAAVTLVVGASRIYLGVHWTSDVVGGYLLAAGWLAALTIAATTQVWHRRRSRSFDRCQRAAARRSRSQRRAHRGPDDPG